MNYTELFTPHHLAVLQDWFAETGELFILLEYPRTASSGDWYYVQSLSQLKDLISQQTRNEIEIFIFRHSPFRVRGIADEELMEQVRQTIPDGTWFHILSTENLTDYRCYFLGAGETHVELQEEMTPLFGRSVIIGIHPFDYDSNQTISRNPDVMQFAVRKNLNYYAPYIQDPERYEEAIRVWQETTER